QPHLAQAGAGLSGGIRSQGGQGLAAELRSVREAARVLGRGMEQDLRLPAVAGVELHPELRSVRRPACRRRSTSAICASNSPPGGRPWMASAFTCRPERSWCCSAPQAAARPRRCVASRASSIPPPAASASAGELMWQASRGGMQVPPRWRTIGMVFQSYAVWPHMTVRQNVAYPLRHRRTPRAEVERKTAEVLELVGLAQFAERSVVSLSGGQMQRVALA